MSVWAIHNISHTWVISDASRNPHHYATPCLTESSPGRPTLLIGANPHKNDGRTEWIVEKKRFSKKFEKTSPSLYSYGCFAQSYVLGRKDLLCVQISQIQRHCSVKYCEREPKFLHVKWPRSAHCLAVISSQIAVNWPLMKAEQSHCTPQHTASIRAKLSFLCMQGLQVGVNIPHEEVHFNHE